jgi:23S rRNA pseudouridine2605 synthase
VPPRYAYWTILIDDKPTAFRAREREELQPTLVQLQRKNGNVVMRWFARGKLWASREAERDDFQMQKHAASAPRERRDGGDAGAPAGPERRGSDWRPGGTHKDPRDRFKKKNRPERAWSEKDPATQRERDKPGYAASRPREPRGDRPWNRNQPGAGASRDTAGPPRGDRPWTDKPPGGAPRGDRPWQNKPPGDRPWGNKPPGDGKRPWTGKPASPPSDRPWQTKPTGPRAQRKPWVGKGASVDASRGNRPWSAKPAGASPRGDRPWSEKPTQGAGGKPPWKPKPSGGPPRGDRPWSAKPTQGAGGKRPWKPKPSGGPPRGDRPWSAKPTEGAGGTRPWKPKPRDLERSAFTPRGPQSGGGPGAPHKKRDDDPDRNS